MADFETYTEYLNGQSSLPSLVDRRSNAHRIPARVVLRATRTGLRRQIVSDNQDYQRRLQLVSLLKQAVERELERYRRQYARPGVTYSIGNVKGFLQGVNLTDASSHITTHPMAVSSMSIDWFDNILEAIHSSNQDIDYVDIEWSWVIDQNSLLIGDSR